MKMKILLKYCLIIGILTIVCSCAHYKYVPYFQNSKEVDLSNSEYQFDLIIQPQDQLNIFVDSENKKLAASFNLRERVGVQANQKIGDAAQAGGFYRYLVDAEGNIEFPIAGKIHVAGLTVEQVSAEVKKALLPYFRDDKSFMVNTYMMNYYVSVLGEVKSPGSFTVERTKMTILEALAKAGDMTIYGKRDNVKLLRERPDGTYEVHEFDMRDANILNSPYYYLRQRDIVYVEPNEAMVQNAKVGQTTQLWVRGTSISISLGSLLYRVLQ